MVRTLQLLDVAFKRFVHAATGRFRSSRGLVLRSRIAVFIFARLGPGVSNPRMNYPRVLCLAMLLFALAGNVRGAEDTYETMRVGTNTYHNVRVIQSNPVEILIGHDDGYKHIRLQDLPDELKKKYPYSAAKADAYRAQQAEQARLLRQQDAAAVRAVFVAREKDLEEKIQATEKELKRLRADIKTETARKRTRAANSLRATLMQVRDRLWSLQDQLERTKKEHRKFE